MGVNESSMTAAPAETLTTRTDAETTTVRVRCTGHVRTEVGEPRLNYEFEGSTLREFLEAFFEEYNVADMLIAETEEEATAHGWAPMEGEPPGDWAKNPEGEQTRAFARVAINGRFNEHLDGLDTGLEEADRVALMYPFIFCC
jgi:molybdopterin converting factor small subunit